VEVAVNDAYIPFITNQDRVLILYGSAASGKSYFTAQKIVLRTISEYGHRFLCLRKVDRTVKNSIYELIKHIISQVGKYNEFNINKTEKTFTHIPTGNTIMCMGLDDPEKVKSIQGITGMWLEEATEFNDVDLDQLRLRIRGKHLNYVQYILTFNPISEYHWLKELVDDIQAGKEGWTYHHSTYKDNLYLTEEDKAVIESYKETNFLYYQIYCLGEWGIEDKTGKFAWAFSEEKHVRTLWANPEYSYLYLSFDFNRDPITCGVIQEVEGEIRVLEAIELPNSNIYWLCEQIRAKYPNYIYIVTGDATGRNLSALTKENIHYYDVIKQELQLNETQIQVPSVNPPIGENRVLVNAILENSKVSIDEVKGKGLIFDLKYVELDENKKIKKDNRSDKKQKADHLDWFRYHLNQHHKDFLRIPKEILDY